MALHHAKLKAAVAKYGALLTAGKSEEEVKAEIAKDEALAPFVDEVYAKITANPEADKEPAATKSKKANGHVVITQFRDKNNWDKLYEVGEDISHLDEDRKADLVSKGLIEAI